MALTAKQEMKLKSMPLIENKITRSKDGKYLLHKTIMTTIRPMSYYEAILADNLKVDEDIISDDDLRKFLEAEV